MSGEHNGQRKPLREEVEKERVRGRVDEGDREGIVFIFDFQYGVRHTANQKRKREQDQVSSDCVLSFAVDRAISLVDFVDEDACYCRQQNHIQIVTGDNWGQSKIRFRVIAMGCKTVEFSHEKEQAHENSQNQGNPMHYRNNS